MEDPDDMALAVANVNTVDTSGSEATKQLVNPERVHRHSDPYDLVCLAQEVQKADQFMRCSASNKLILIAEQIRHLQEQARKVLEETKRDAELHHAQCNFKKRVGQIYSLYKRNNGTTYFSMLGPQEWGPSCPHEFLGQYRLEADMSWTKAEDIERRSKDIRMVDNILASNVPAIQYLTGPAGNGMHKIKETEEPKIVDVSDQPFVEEPLYK
ncbi:predicted protein [Nematostella vectensis]|uniref:Uncharacterized protein n=1 Tax=Nematostella vectensis TaxID=45351 RepID=A7SZ56_NEMVE|nr:uncharacterized protein C1orf50 homolog [Nematostella vectensis]EDO31002.1 predicted protein [Nematostella vectensis]|eukprot:XP_001623102.1 predicted protein [Nematostella vectensis]